MRVFFNKSDLGYNTGEIGDKIMNTIQPRHERYKVKSRVYADFVPWLWSVLILGVIVCVMVIVNMVYAWC